MNMKTSEISDVNPDRSPKKISKIGIVSPFLTKIEHIQKVNSIKKRRWVEAEQNKPIVVRLKGRNIIIPVAFIPLTRLTPQEIERFQKPAKRRKYTDTFRCNVSSKKELDLNVKKLNVGKREIRHYSFPETKKVDTLPKIIEPRKLFEAKLTAPGSGKINQPPVTKGINGKVKQTYNETPVFSVKRTTHPQVESLAKTNSERSQSHKHHSRKSKSKKPVALDTPQVKKNNLNEVKDRPNFTFGVASTTSTAAYIARQKDKNNHIQERKLIHTERPASEIKIPKTVTKRYVGFKIPKSKPTVEILQTGLESQFRSLTALTEITSEHGTRTENNYVQAKVPVKVTKDLSTCVKSVSYKFAQTDKCKKLDSTDTNDTVEGHSSNTAVRKEDKKAEFEQNHVVATNSGAIVTHTIESLAYDDDDQDVLDLCVIDNEFDEFR